VHFSRFVSGRLLSNQNLGRGFLREKVLLGLSPTDSGEEPCTKEGSLWGGRAGEQDNLRLRGRGGGRQGQRDQPAPDRVPAARSDADGDPQRVRRQSPGPDQLPSGRAP
jgi:hypothetical protein